MQMILRSWSSREVNKIMKAEPTFDEIFNEWYEQDVVEASE